MRVIHDLDRGRYDTGVLVLLVVVRADEAVIPYPAVLRVAGRVDADESTAGAAIALKRRLLGRIENVAGGQQEDHRIVARQPLVGELSGILSEIGAPAMLTRQLTERCLRRGNRVVAELGGLREDENRRRTGASARGGLLVRNGDACALRCRRGGVAHRRWRTAGEEHRRQRDTECQRNHEGSAAAHCANRPPRHFRRAAPVARPAATAPRARSARLRSRGPAHAAPWL